MRAEFDIHLPFIGEASKRESGPQLACNMNPSK
ncbi:hypothetical protein ABIB73_006024 [Bradyrhizobium sp. F1.4.3]